MKILFLERVITDYRVPFYLRLNDLLAKEKIDLTVAGGNARPDESLVNCVGKLPFGIQVSNRYIFGKAYMQTEAGRLVKNANLIITGQENSSVSTYPLLFGKRQTKIAFYDHGPNPIKSGGQTSVAYRLKRWMTLKPDWWFAYTERSRQAIMEAGYPGGKITVVNNSIDTSALEKKTTDISDKEKNELLEKLFGKSDDNKKPIVGISCARLLENKKIPFLLSAISKIHMALPNFKMIIIGDGPFKKEVDQFCSANNWCRSPGSIRGLDRAKYLSVADCWLNPGALGLAILDAFASHIPLFTTSLDSHGPEIAYLEPGINGIETLHDIENYSSEIVDIIRDDKTLDRFKNGAQVSCAKYGIDQMAQRFVEGIKKIFEADKGL